MKENKISYITHSFMWEKLGLSGANLIIYAIIYSFSKDGRGSFHGKQESLAKITGKSRATVNAKLKELVSSGLIEDMGESEFRTKTYRVNLERLKNTEQANATELTYKRDEISAVDSEASVKFGTYEPFTEVSDYESDTVKQFDSKCQEVLHNNKKDNKEIRLHTTAAASKDASARKERISRMCEISEKRLQRAYDKLDEARERGKDFKTIDTLEKDVETAERTYAKCEFAHNLSDRVEIDESYFESFDFYGRKELILLSTTQYNYLCNWIGCDALITYFHKLERFIEEHPESHIHSHFAILKKWIKKDFSVS